MEYTPRRGLRAQPTAAEMGMRVTRPLTRAEIRA
jgi:hypothetical protein